VHENADVLNWFSQSIEIGRSVFAKAVRLG
jgi:hypothetical protein